MHGADAGPSSIQRSAELAATPSPFRTGRQARRSPRQSSPSRRSRACDFQSNASRDVQCTVTLSQPAAFAARSDAMLEFDTLEQNRAVRLLPLTACHLLNDDVRELAPLDILSEFGRGHRIRFDSEHTPTRINLSGGSNEKWPT